MRMKNPKLFKKNILGLFLIFMLCFSFTNWGMVPAVEAKTAESNPAENIFFYVTNQDGKDILLDVMSLSELAAISHGQLSGVTDGEDTGKNYYFSCTDNLPTTVYTEAQGFTLPELIEHVKASSPVARAESIAYAGKDRLYFMATDSNGAYNRNWSYDQLFAAPQYYFPGLFDSWNSNWEISDSTYGPTDTNPIPLDIYNSNYKEGDPYYEAKRTVFAKGQLTVPILAAQMETDRVSNLSAEVAANDGQVTGCLKDTLTADRSLQLCIPQTEAALMSGNRTAYHYFAWIYNLKLVMDVKPEISSLGTVAAPTANVVLNGDKLSITMDCATADAQIYYSLTDGSPQTLYTTGEEVIWKIGSRDLTANPVTFTVTAVKPGYDDAGIVSVTYPQRAPAFTDIYNATVGNDVSFTAVSSVSSQDWDDWSNSITGVGIKYPGAAGYTILDKSQYTLNDSTKTITFAQSLFSTYGAHSLQIIADGYANKNISVTMRKVAPEVVTKDYYLGSDIVLSFADTEYQSGITVSVKKEGASSSSSISGTYVKQNIPGKLTIDKTYFNAFNCALTAPGNYILTLSNSNYSPASQTIPIIVKAAAEKPPEDNFVFTLTPSVSAGQVGEPISVSAALVSDGDSYDFYAGEYRIVWDETALTLGTVAAEGKWKSGSRTIDGQTILTFAALDETDEGVPSSSPAEIGSFTITPVTEGVASISCARALLTNADAQALNNVTGNGLQINIGEIPEGSGPAQSLIVNILNPDGSTTLVHEYGYTELEALEEIEYYASIDALPIGVGTKARGVKINALIEDAHHYNSNIKWESGQRLVLYVTDSASAYQPAYYTYDNLYGQDRYYYPYLVASYDPAAGRDSASLDDAILVEPMLASISYQARRATDADLRDEETAKMDGTESFRFCMGLTADEVRDEEFSSTNKFAKWVYRVDIGPVSGQRLSADTTNNEVGQPIEITFIDNSAWREAISEVRVDGAVLDEKQYSVTTGKITIKPGVFTAAGDYTITVEAAGFIDSTVAQTILGEQGAETTAQYELTPAEDEVYTSGETPDGIIMMTVNSGISGMKYFAVSVAPVLPHEGLETVVFSHWRGGSQLALNALQADFDVVTEAQAGFNVQPGDIIKAYIIDQLTNDPDQNPVLFQ